MNKRFNRRWGNRKSCFWMLYCFWWTKNHNNNNWNTQSNQAVKNGKSDGPDMLLNEFFIHGVNELLHYLYNLFNKILDLGHFPEVGSEGYVVPIHKKGKLDDVNNFRGITLLSTLGKLFTRVLNNRLTTWAEEYYVYIEAQAGFRANMSTTDNVFVLHGIINHMLNSNKNCFVHL